MISPRKGRSISGHGCLANRGTSFFFDMAWRVVVKFSVLILFKKPIQTPIPSFLMLFCSNPGRWAGPGDGSQRPFRTTVIQNFASCRSIHPLKAKIVNRSRTEESVWMRRASHRAFHRRASAMTTLRSRGPRGAGVPPAYPPLQCAECK